MLMAESSVHCVFAVQSYVDAEHAIKTKRLSCIYFGTLAFSTFAGTVIAIKRRLRRPKRANGTNGITEIKTMKDSEESQHHQFIGYDPVLEAQRQRFEEERVQLLGNDAALHWADRARRCASDSEIRADRIIRMIREDERDGLFGNIASEAIPKPDTRDMGGQFLTNRDRINSSKVYDIATRMPKGSHLHLHFNAELEPKLLMSRAKYLPNNMFVRTTQPLLTEKDHNETEVVFSVLPDDTPRANCFSQQYNPDFRTAGATPWMRWVDFCDVFRKTSSEDAEHWALNKMVLSQDEVYGIDQTTNGIWARFNQATRCFKGLMNYESAYRWYVGKMVENMIHDRIMYAELRPMLLDKSIPSDDGRRKLNHKDQMVILLEEVKRKQDELAAQGELDKFPFGVKIIYCTPRSIPKKIMEREINDCIELKRQFPDLICGFDLVGAEDRPNHIGFYRDELLNMQVRCEAEGLDIPFVFHAGESLLDMGGSKDPQNSNLYDAVLLKSKRIGHGFSLLKHPNLLQLFKERQICIELCTTSNELLHLCRNIKEHPFPELLAAGIPCTLNSDNPSLFSNSVSYEFYQVMVGSPTMTLHGWRQLAEWSITHSLLSEQDKKRAHTIHRREWQVFVEWIVATYAQEAERIETRDREAAAAAKAGASNATSTATSPVSPVKGGAAVR